MGQTARLSHAETLTLSKLLVRWIGEVEARLLALEMEATPWAVPTAYGLPETEPAENAITWEQDAIREAHNEEERKSSGKEASTIGATSEST